MVCYRLKKHSIYLVQDTRPRKLIAYNPYTLPVFSLLPPTRLSHTPRPIPQPSNVY